MIETATSKASFLYVPADQPRLVAKARSRPGAIILDLEDSVAPSRKGEALAAAVAFLQDDASHDEAWVRINPGAAGLYEAELLTECPNLAGLWIPKAEEPAHVQDIASRVSDTPGDGPALGLLIESARGVLALAELLRLPETQQVQLGEIDLAADLRHAASDSENMTWFRHWLITHAAAAGLPQPVGPVDADYTNLAGFRASCLSLRDIGFGSRACIHPAQADIAEQVFGTSAEDLVAAHALLDRYEAALRENRGALGDGSGSMIDAASVRSARRLTGR
ncbi:citrate lyase subunit beta/citryl-CoA lyase/(S)-citramalyl-CoA lyase [Arthrobacter sp. SLBN-100]|uniref:HpcH/HpaI aldolase/citrate lyase family protein n=1 Tax=Arthrobacter sp. SLBN-100 TaxID=2768450 RepID=UPI001151EE67|nr:aldolase/citrate lyase family protein [Arthrobacter sp. SLBN-100]TQJ69621.1 citrate lyase subunit beta/citryl-CoA lyase/(S)-citramalyl-CoA lyase [Arthrobacter sp. SLBN-100]